MTWAKALKAWALPVTGTGGMMFALLLYTIASSSGLAGAEAAVNESQSVGEIQSDVDHNLTEAREDLQQNLSTEMRLMTAGLPTTTFQIAEPVAVKSVAIGAAYPALARFHGTVIAPLVVFLTGSTVVLKTLGKIKEALE